MSDSSRRRFTMSDASTASGGGSERRIARYFRETLDTFRQAEQAVGSRERCYTIAGHTVRLRFAGETLLRHIAPALAHLAAEPVAAPALTICLWDTVSTRVPAAAFPWSAEARAGLDAGNRDRPDARPVFYIHDDRFHGIFEPRSELLSMLDTELSTALFRIPHSSRIRYYETGAPLREILYWWSRGRGLQFAHAGAVGTENGGVLLAGRGGSGKSTVALAALESELLYAGDDYVLLEAEPVPCAYSIYNSAKLNPTGLCRLPRVAAIVDELPPVESEKVILFIHDCFPEKIARRVGIRAILLPEVARLRRSRLTEATAAASLAALAPSTMLQLRGAAGEDLQRLVRFVRSVPSFRLELGEDMSAVPRMILDLCA